MWYSVWVNFGGQQTEHKVFVPKEQVKAQDKLEQAIDDHVSDIISNELEIKYAPVRGS